MYASTTVITVCYLPHGVSPGNSILLDRAVMKMHVEKINLQKCAIHLCPKVNIKFIKCI